MASMNGGVKRTQTANGTPVADHVNGYSKSHWTTLDTSTSVPEPKRTQSGERQEGNLLTSNFIKLSTCTLAGVAFGFAAEKAKGI